MRTLIRKNRSVSYETQMFQRQLDAERSRSHPRSQRNTEERRRASLADRLSQAPRSRGKPARLKSARSHEWQSIADGLVRDLVARGWRVRSSRMRTLPS